MNIPQNIIHDRKIISNNVYNYHQSLSNRLNENGKHLEKKNMLNYNKDKIIKWFCGLNSETRFKICSIYNNWLTKIIFQMATYVKYDPVIEFTPMDAYEEFSKNKQNNIYNDYRNYEDYNNFDNFFRGENNVKKGCGTPDSKELQKIKEKRFNETEFMNEIRFLSLDEFNDTITMSLDLINRPEQIIKYFNFFSDNQCFTSKIEKMKNYNFSFPKWIYGYNSYSIYQLLVIFFEQKISIYYQIYLIENKIPEFDIDIKISYLLKKKSNIEDYLLKKITKNDNNNYIDYESDKYDFIDEQKILNTLESQKKIIQYYENKTDLVYSCAFGSSLNENFYDDNSKKKEFNIKIKELKKLFKKNIYDFVNKISFIEIKDAFLYPNFLYYILYQQLIEQSSNQNWDELLIEDENKMKSLKNKKNKKHKKRRNKKNKNNNNNLEDNNNSVKSEILNIDQEKEKNINDNNNNNGNDNINVNKDDDNKEEEIEEIPSDIIEPNKESKEEIIEVELYNNVGSINDINNSTVSSSNTNKSSKDPYFFEPKFNNFFRGDKKEGEILKKDLNDEEEHNDNIDEKLEIEDISENDISEETINNDDIYINVNQNQLNNKKKKKNKRKNKKNKANNNNINKNQEKEKDNISQNQNDININNNNSNIKNNNENIKLNQEEAKEKEKDKIKKEEKSEKSKDEIKIINSENESTKEIKKNESEEKIEKNEKSEKSNKVKKNKEFFLFPVCPQNKKKGNKKENKKKEISKDETPKSSNENKREMMTQTENTPTNENKNISSQSSQKKNILIKTNVSEIEFNVSKNKTEAKKDITSEEKSGVNKILNYNINNYNSQYCNFNLYYISQQPQPQYPNILFYPNCNDSLLIFQNEFFSILDKEILDYEKNVDNNMNKIKIYREQILNNIKKFISKILDDKYNFEFLLYGSYSTGLSIEISDIDILIKFAIKNKSKNSEINSQQNIENILSLLEKNLEPNKEKLYISQINPIYTASVPVLKIECILKEIIPENIQRELSETYLFNFENEILKLNLDFTFHEVNDIKVTESIPSQEILSYIKDKINLYPSIRPNLLVLKRYMQITKLNSSFHGGLSSYSLFLLLYSLYKQIYGKNEINNAEYLGRELFNFFSFYGNLDFEINCIDAKSDSPIYPLNNIHKNNILLVDPITGLNVAKSTFKIEHIKYAFNNAVMIINNFFYKKMNTLKVNEDYKILEQLFNPIFNYNNIFIPDEAL